MTTHEFNKLQKGLQKYAADTPATPVPVAPPKPAETGLPPAIKPIKATSAPAVQKPKAHIPGEKPPYGAALRMGFDNVYHGQTTRLPSLGPNVREWSPSQTPWAPKFENMAENWDPHVAGTVEHIRENGYRTGQIQRAPEDQKWVDNWIANNGVLPQQDTATPADAPLEAPVAQPSAGSAPPTSAAPASVTPPVTSAGPVEPVGPPSLTGPEATTPNPAGGASPAQQPPVTAPAPEPAPAQPQPADAAVTPPVGTDVAPPVSTHAGPADALFADIMPKLNDDKIPVPERQQMAMTVVNKHVQGSPQLLQGMQDIHAGRNDTPAAKVFQSQIDNAKNQMIKAEFEKLKQINPGADFSNPRTYAGFVSQAANTATTKFNEMPMEHKMLTGLGLGGGLIGILSSLFGGGGMAGGLLGMLGLAAGGMAGAAGGMFGDQARTQTGRMMNDAASFFGVADVPTAEQLGTAGEAQTKQQIQNAMNQTGENGQRGGWGAGQKIIDARRAQADKLFQMPRAMAITSLMGLRGEGTPTTEAAAGTMLDGLAQRRQAAGQQDFLRTSARNQARETLRAQDKDGVLQAMLKGRGEKGPGVNFLREGAVRSQFNTPENKMFLGPNGELPAGTTEDEFIDNMLRHAYGEYPAPASQPAPQRETRASMNIAQQIFFKQAALKAARCWAGYEPAPGKAPYSDNSCRPKRKKKTKTKQSSEKVAAPGYTGAHSTTPFDAQHARQLLRMGASTSDQMVYNKLMEAHRQNSFTPAQFSDLRDKYQGLPPAFSATTPTAAPVSPGQMAAPVTPAQTAVKLPVNRGPRNPTPAFKGRSIRQPAVAPAPAATGYIMGSGATASR